MLTMALIGCLPDNVQQAIKSFSIRTGKQHITFAFPFMEETLRSFCEANPADDATEMSLKPEMGSNVLFFDECLEVVHGFQTYVTVLPYLNKPCPRSSLPVVMLTLYQRDSTEGICRHFQSLLRTLVERRDTSSLWKLPVMVAELSNKHSEMVLDICAETVNEIQSENLNRSFPGKTSEQMINLIKDKILRPCLMSYPEYLRRNTQDVMRELTSTDPNYFLSLVELLQSTTCSILDFKKVDMMFKSPGFDPAIRRMWRVWGHEQISRKVFPVTMATAPLSKLGPLYGHLRGPTDLVGPPTTGPGALVSVGTLSHVPVKEGLQSVIKCLKSQDISQIKPKSLEHDKKFASCNCSVCQIQPTARRNTRLRLYGDFTKQSLTSPAECSAFHLPLQKRPPLSTENPPTYCNRTSTFRLQSTSFSYHHGALLSSASDARTQQYTGFDLPLDVAYEPVQNRSSYSSASSSSHVVQPVPHYLPINLKAFSQRVLYGYPMLNKQQYSLPSRQNL